MKNKKAATSLSILALVVMALVLSGAALFTFATSQGGINKKITDARFVENFYVKEAQIEFFLKQVAESRLPESAQFIVSDFKQSFEEKIAEFEFDDVAFSEMRRRVIAKEYDVFVDDKKIHLDLKEFLMIGTRKTEKKKFVWVWYVIPAGRKTIIKEQLGIIYKTDLEIEIDNKNI